MILKFRFRKLLEQWPDRLADVIVPGLVVIAALLLIRLAVPEGIHGMGKGEKTRLVAWSIELRDVHARLRRALSVTKEALAAGEGADGPGRDLLLFCHGFCTALTGHHEGEDRELFPAIAAQHPALRDTLRKLEQDHAMMAHLIGGLQAAIDSKAPPSELGRHLDGLSAIVESHFRYEERQLLAVLDELELDADPGQVLGPL